MLVYWYRDFCYNTKESKNTLKNKQNELIDDKTGKQEGRGAYICNNIEC